MIRNAIQYLAPGSSLGYSFPPESFFTEALAETKYTKDIAKLEEHSWQLYFACDETQLGHLKQNLLGENEYQLPGFTQSSFNYWDGGPIFGSVPLEVTGYHNVMPFYPDIAKIKGQILKIRPQAFIKLDTYKENTVQFDRVKVRIIVPFSHLKYLHDSGLPPEDCAQILSGKLYRTKEICCVIRAWMYIGRPEYWNKLISNYDWASVPTYQAKNRQWCPQYYQLRRPPVKS